MLRSSIRAPATATLVPLALGLLLATPLAAEAQGFNCRYAHYADEAAICQDSALGRLDDQLTSAYNNVYRRLPPDAQRRLDRDEDAWLLQRRQCGADPRCLTEAYQQRMSALQGEIGNGTPSHNPPPGFPVPPPQFRPFGGGPVAVGPGFPPPLPPGFRQAGQGGVEERDTRAPLIERRQSTETVEERDTRESQPARQNDRTTEGPSQTTTVTTETRSAPDQGDTETSQRWPERKSSKHTKTNRPAKRETVTESHTDQATPDKPAAETEASPKPAKETHAATQPPSPRPPLSSSTEPPAAKPAKAATRPTREQKREAIAAPAQPQQSSGSSEAPVKPAIRWVDPPPSQ